MIRLIASDIDGTLLHNGAAEIDPVIFEEIHRLKQKGILFCPASGRQYHSLRRLFAPAADELTYLCENGALLFGPGSPGQLLGKTVMERERALALAHQIMDIPACEVLISGVNTSYLCPKKRDVVDHIRYFVGNNLAILPTVEDMPEDIVKVSAYCPQGAVEVQPVLGPKWENTFHHAIAGEAWLDFNLANKGTGLGMSPRLKIYFQFILPMLILVILLVGLGSWGWRALICAAVAVFVWFMARRSSSKSTI